MIKSIDSLRLSSMSFIYVRFAEKRYHVWTIKAWWRGMWLVVKVFFRQNSLIVSSHFPCCLSFPLIFQTAWVSSPKECNFPETIPEEASSVEEERVVIFRLPSSSTFKPSIYTAVNRPKFTFRIYSRDSRIFFSHPGRREPLPAKSGAYCWSHRRWMSPGDKIRFW